MWTKWCPLILYLVLLLASLLGISAKGEDWANWLQPWSGYVFVGLLLWTAWNGGRAWADSKQAAIRLGGNLEYDLRYCMFNLEVENVGSQSEVFARVFADNFRNKGGRRKTEIAVSPIEVCWRGLPPGNPMKLRKGDPRLAGVLYVDTKNPGYPLLELLTPLHHNDPDDAIRPVPLVVDRQIRFDLRVEFRDADDKYLAHRSKELVVVPDHDSFMFYRVYPVGIRFFIWRLRQSLRPWLQ